MTDEVADERGPVDDRARHALRARAPLGAIESLEGAQDICALTTSREYLARKTRAFIDFFRGRVGSPPYWERGLAAPT